MIKKFFFALLALIPLYSFSSTGKSDKVYGYWEDYRTGISLKIKPAKRKGILVKRTDRRSKWVRYDQIGRNHYDDCYGSRIRLTGYGLKWSRKYSRKTIYLERSDYRRGYYDREDYYDRDYRYDSYYGDYGRRNNIPSDYLGGKWYCSDYKVEIEIGYHRGGIRVRRLGDRCYGDDWYEYRRDDRNSRRYYGDGGNYYELDGRDLYFRDKRNSKKLKFRRRSNY